MSSQNRGEETAVYRFGIVGYGWLGGVIGGQIRDHERTTVVSVADITAKVRRRAGEDLTLSEGALYESYGELLATEEFDASHAPLQAGHRRA